MKNKERIEELEHIAAGLALRINQLESQVQELNNRNYLQPKPAWQYPEPFPMWNVPQPITCKQS